MNPAFVSTSPVFTVVGCTHTPFFGAVCGLEWKLSQGFGSLFLSQGMILTIDLHIAVFWIIQSNKNISFDFQNRCPYWILNGPW